MNAACPKNRADLLAPGRLWSLLDMLRFYAASFATAVGAIQRAALHISAANAANLQPDDNTDREIVRNALAEAKPSLDGLPLSRVVSAQFDRLVKQLDGASSIELIVLIREFNNNLLTELTSAYFLMITSDVREYYEQRLPPFGESVAQVFPETVNDIAAASRCYALDEWTACVFHLMRVLEHGLLALASNVGLSREIVAHENWKNVIDQIERKIREMEGAPKSAEKIEHIRILSSLATQFRYFKDAWRNHVSHSRVSHDRHTGAPVWTHVKAFMEGMGALPAP